MAGPRGPLTLTTGCSPAGGGCVVRCATQTAAVDWLDTLKTYREERVAVEEAWNERAVVDDFHRAHVDLDRTQFDYMRQSVYDMRDRYAAIHDLVTKNWRLLKQPRTGERLSYN